MCAKSYEKMLKVDECYFLSTNAFFPVKKTKVGMQRARKEQPAGVKKHHISKYFYIVLKLPFIVYDFNSKIFQKLSFKE